VTAGSAGNTRATPRREETDFPSPRWCPVEALHDPAMPGVLAHFAGERPVPEKTVTHRQCRRSAGCLRARRSGQVTRQGETWTLLVNRKGYGRDGRLLLAPRKGEGNPAWPREKKEEVPYACLEGKKKRGNSGRFSATPSPTQQRGGTSLSDTGGGGGGCPPSLGPKKGREKRRPSVELSGKTRTAPRGTALRPPEHGRRHGQKLVTLMPGKKPLAVRPAWWRIPFTRRREPGSRGEGKGTNFGPECRCQAPSLSTKKERARTSCIKKGWQTTTSRKREKATG